MGFNFISMEQEIWKDIPGYEWKYQVSNIGLIKSKNKILNPYINKYWYKQTILLKNKIKKTVLIHRMILLSFIWKSLLQVNHKNWIKTDNRLDNLEYCTHSENQLHRRRILKQKY